MSNAHHLGLAVLQVWREFHTRPAMPCSDRINAAFDAWKAAGFPIYADAYPTDNDPDHVWLTAEPQDNRIAVVKALRAVTDLGLAEAKRIALDGESGFPVCLTGGIHRVGTDVDPKVRLPVEVRTLHRGRKELAATLAALGVPHHVGARPPIPRLPGAAEYEARATSREDDRAQLCDALGLPGLSWDEALAEVRRRGGAGEEGKRRES